MTSNSATLPVADWSSASAGAETYREGRRGRPWPQWHPQHQGGITVLDPTMQSPEAEAFERELRSRIIGQDRSIRQLARVYQVYLSGLSLPGRPLANLLLLGPTGSGKTRLVEATAEAVFGDARAGVTLDCAEFERRHDLAKLVGPPPGRLVNRGQ